MSDAVCLTNSGSEQKMGKIWDGRGSPSLGTGPSEFSGKSLAQPSKLGWGPGCCHLLLLAAHRVYLGGSKD